MNYHENYEISIAKKRLVQGEFSQLLDKKLADFSEKLIDFEFESIPV